MPECLLRRRLRHHGYSRALPRGVTNAPSAAQTCHPNYTKARRAGWGTLSFAYESYPAHVHGPVGSTTPAGEEPAKSGGKYREKIGGKDRSTLQYRLVRYDHGSFSDAPLPPIGRAPLCAGILCQHLYAKLHTLKQSLH